MVFTERDEDILTTLTKKGRLLDESQLATTWWSDSHSGRNEAKRRGRQLIDAGLLQRRIVLSRLLPQLTAPVITWEPNHHKPDLAQAAAIFQRRWSAPPCPTPVYLATAKAAAITGGVAPGLKHPLQCGHDRGLMSVFIRLKREHPALAEAWLGEDSVSWPRGLRVRRPDAVIVGASGEIKIAIEMGGSGAAYGRVRLEAWHDQLSAQALPYLFW